MKGFDEIILLFVIVNIIGAIFKKLNKKKILHQTYTKSTQEKESNTRQEISVFDILKNDFNLESQYTVQEFETQYKEKEDNESNYIPENINKEQIKSEYISPVHKTIDTNTKPKIEIRQQQNQNSNRLQNALGNKNSLRQAILLSEILDAPLALRR